MVDGEGKMGGSVAFAKIMPPTFDSNAISFSARMESQEGFGKGGKTVGKRVPFRESPPCGGDEPNEPRAAAKQLENYVSFRG